MALGIKKQLCSYVILCSLVLLVVSIGCSEKPATQKLDILFKQNLLYAIDSEEKLIAIDTKTDKIITKVPIAAGGVFIAKSANKLFALYTGPGFSGPPFGYTIVTRGRLKHYHTTSNQLAPEIAYVPRKGKYLFLEGNIFGGAVNIKTGQFIPYNKFLTISNPKQVFVLGMLERPNKPDLLAISYSIFMNGAYRVDFLDVDSLKKVKTDELPFTFTTALSTKPGRAYIALYRNKNEALEKRIAIYNYDKFRIEDFINLPAQPKYIKKRGSFVVVSYFDSKYITLIKNDRPYVNLNLKSGEAITDLAIVKNKVYLLIDNDNKEIAQLRILDTTTRKTEKSINLGSAATDIQQIGNKLYISDSIDGTIRVFDIKINKITKSIQAGYSMWALASTSQPTDRFDFEAQEIMQREGKYSKD